MANRIDLERPDLRQSQGFPVLTFQAIVVDVLDLGFSGPNPAFSRPPASSHRCSKICLTLGVIGNVLRAAFDLPCTMRIVPLRAINPRDAFLT